VKYDELSFSAFSYLKTKSSKFEDKFTGKDRRKKHIEIIQGIRVVVRLFVELHRQCYGVDHDENEDRVFERLRCHEPPNFVLDSLLGNVAANRLGLQSELDAVPLKSKGNFSHAASLQGLKKKKFCQ